MNDFIIYLIGVFLVSIGAVFFGFPVGYAYRRSIERKRLLESEVYLYKTNDVLSASIIGKSEAQNGR